MGLDPEDPPSPPREMDAECNRETGAYMDGGGQGMKLEVKERREFQCKFPEQREVLASRTGGQQRLGSCRTQVDTDTDHAAHHPLGWLSKMSK